MILDEKASTAFLCWALIIPVPMEYAKRKMHLKYIKNSKSAAASLDIMVVRMSFLF